MITGNEPHGGHCLPLAEHLCCLTLLTASPIPDEIHSCLCVVLTHSGRFHIVPFKFPHFPYPSTGQPSNVQRQDPNSHCKRHCPEVGTPLPPTHKTLSPHTAGNASTLLMSINRIISRGNLPCMWKQSVWYFQFAETPLVFSSNTRWLVYQNNRLDNTNAQVASCIGQMLSQ